MLLKVVYSTSIIITLFVLYLPLFAFVGIFGLFVFYMVFGYFAQLICNFVGFIYPAYVSYVYISIVVILLLMEFFYFLLLESKHWKVPRKRMTLVGWPIGLYFQPSVLLNSFPTLSSVGFHSIGLLRFSSLSGVMLQWKIMDLLMCTHELSDHCSWRIQTRLITSTRR